jgi:hypothetical protein
LISESNLPDLARLRAALVAAHAVRWRTDDLLIGLQLTHSGRFSRPNGRLEPHILYHHPILDRRFKLPSDYPMLSDGEINRLIEDPSTARLLEGQVCLRGHQALPWVSQSQILSAVDRPAGPALIRRPLPANYSQRQSGPLSRQVRLSAFDYIARPVWMARRFERCRGQLPLRFRGDAADGY